MASRLSQVLKCGWQHAGEMASSHNENQIARFRIFIDILRCFHKYKMWSNQYLKEDFYYKDSNERQEIGKKYLESGLIRDAWQKDFRETRKFLIKKLLRNTYSDFLRHINAYLYNPNDDTKHLVVDDLDIHSEYLGLKYSFVKSNPQLYNDFSCL